MLFLLLKFQFHFQAHASLVKNSSPRFKSLLMPSLWIAQIPKRLSLNFDPIPSFLIATYLILSKSSQHLDLKLIKLYAILLSFDLFRLSFHEALIFLCLLLFRGVSTNIIHKKSSTFHLFAFVNNYFLFYHATYLC